MVDDIRISVVIPLYNEEESLAELYLTGKITINDAMGYSHNQQELSEMLSRHKSPAYS